MGLLRGRKQYFQSPFRGWIERLDDAIFLDRDDAFDVVQDGMQWALLNKECLSLCLTFDYIHVNK